MHPAVRRQVGRLHRWLGLGLGGLYVLLGLSGSLLVFYPEIDRLLNPATQAAEPMRPLPAIDAVIAVLRQAEPGRDGPWRIELPLTPDSPYYARYYRPEETEQRAFAPLMLSIDPATLAVTSRRFWGEYPVTWIYDLHYTLLWDRSGRTLLAVIGIALVLLLASGVALWWPSGRRVPAALSIRRNAASPRRIYDLHTVIAVWTLPLSAVLLTTGLLLEKPAWFKPAIESLAPLTPYYDAHDEQALAGPPAVSGQSAIETAQEIFPGATLRWIETPGRGHPAWRVQMAQASEPGQRFPRSQVWVDAQSGAVLAVRDPRRNTSADTLMDWLHPLHNGEAFGLPGRIAVCIAGLLPLIAFATGVVRWRQKALARHRARHGNGQTIADGQKSRMTPNG